MKKILSYFHPIRIKNYTSTINGSLEITYTNGKKVLDTKTSNYSFGSLQKILKKGLKAVNFDKNVQNILVLGMGGGSVVETIRKDFNSEAHLTLIDIDPQIISIAKDEFHILKFKNIKIIEADAFQFVKNNNKTYDLIIVDIFIIDTVPEIFTTEEFLSNLSKISFTKGKLIYNTMESTMKKKDFNKILKILSHNNIKTKIISKVEGTNNLILGEKE